MQIFGLAALRIETAGSQAGTVDLAMLDVGTAESLRTWVLSRRTAGVVDNADPNPAAATLAAPTPEVVMFAISGGRLVLAGVTASAVAFVAAFVVAAVPVAVAFSASVGIAAYALTLWLLFLAAVVAALSTIGSLLTYARYTLSLAGDDLRLTHGALERRHVTLPRARVQHIEISDNPLRRAFGVVSVSFRSAASIGADRGGATGRVDIPIVNRADIPGLLAALMGARSWTPPELQPRPTAARRRGIVRRTAPLLALAAILLVIEPIAGVIAFGVAVVGIPWGVAAHRRAGHAVTPSITAFGAGVLHHRLHLVPIERIQSARTVQSPFQRRVDLTTFALDIAGSASAPGLYDLDVEAATSLRRALPRRALE